MHLRSLGRRWITVLVIGAAASAALVVPAAPASAGTGSFFLNPGEGLGPQGRLVSTDGQYVLVMQGDGNLVVYAPGNRAIWASGSRVGNSDVQMQGDGNLVVYAPPPNRYAVWASGTSGNLHAEMQTDGNLVLYTGGQPRQGVWSTAAIRDRNNIFQVKGGGYVAMRDRGWSDSEWPCLEPLWNNESGWRWNADNPSSHAYGVPQALPATKMATAGTDWHENPATQITWGLSYISGRYGSPCAAWSYWQSHHSY
jgi:hypothetical protein